MIKLFDYFKPVWTVREKYSGNVTGYCESNQCLEPCYFWQARKSARKLNIHYSVKGYGGYSNYDVVRWDYFSEE